MKYAYITTVDNKEKITSSNTSYTQITTEDGEVYFFTEAQLKTASNRAKKNPEDICNSKLSNALIKFISFFSK